MLTVFDDWLADENSKRQLNNTICVIINIAQASLMPIFKIQATGVFLSRRLVLMDFNLVFSLTGTVCLTQNNK